MPTYHNESDKKAYIMNMYTYPNYRRQKIAFKLLDLLLEEVNQANFTRNNRRRKAFI